jgi:hypothetical protein
MIILLGQVRELRHLREETILNIIWIGLLSVQALMIIGLAIMGVIRRMKAKRMFKDMQYMKLQLL